MWKWGIAASFLIHGLIAFVILVGIPFELPKPEAEEVVSVEIVPPEQEKATEEPQAPPAPPAEAKEDAQPPPPPPPAAEPSPPAPAAEAPKTPPPVEKQQEPSQPPPTEAPAEPEQSSPATSPENFRPVFQFGEKDAGPKSAENGESDRSEAATQPAEIDSADAADAAVEPPDSAAPDAAAQDEPQNNEQNGPAGASVPQMAVPEVGSGLPAADAAGAQAPATDNPGVDTEIAPTASGQEKKPAEPAAQTADGAGNAKPAGLKQAKRLYSNHATDNPFVMEAMKQMSRGERAGALCNTELGEQLVRGSPYRPQQLPKPTLESGNIIDVQTAFSADGHWYDVSLRCEVDGQAMKVVSFAYKVGKAIPKSEWRKRGFPSY